MPVLSKLAVPYGIGEDYRVEWATSGGNQRGRRMQREPFAPCASARIMPLPDYGLVRERFDDGCGNRAYRILMHAGYFSERRFARYVREYLGGEMTRLQAHHSFGYQADKADNPWGYQLCRTVRTGKCSREVFCNLMDVLDYMQYCFRNNIEL